VEREVEDIAALLEMMGGSAHVYGCSSGAVLAARAAASLQVTKLAVYEPPLALDGTHTPEPADYREQITAALQRGDRSSAVKQFMRVVGVPGFVIAMMRVMPGAWKGLTAVAHTLPYDFAVNGETQSGGPMPPELADKLRAIKAETLAMSGGKSPAWMAHAAKKIAELVPGAKYAQVPKSDHNVSAQAIAPFLLDHFGASAQRAAA
jgi:pimeloyl-ACP methyl ester carboxylesterase